MSRSNAPASHRWTATARLSGGISAGLLVASPPVHEFFMLLTTRLGGVPFAEKTLSHGLAQVLEVLGLDRRAGGQRVGEVEGVRAERDTSLVDGDAQGEDVRGLDELPRAEIGEGDGREARGGTE